MTAITFLFVLLLIIVALGFALKLFVEGMRGLTAELLSQLSKVQSFDKTAFLNATFSSVRTSVQSCIQLSSHVTRGAVEMAFPEPIPVEPAFDWSVYDTPAWQRKGILVY